MRRTVAVLAALAVTLTLLGLTRHLLLVTTTEDVAYTASTDYSVAVPAIDLGEGWQTTLHIQNAGDAPTSARIEFFGADDAECPAIRQPFAVRCVGSIPAGAVDTFGVGGDPELAEARSAIVHSARPGDAGCSTAPGEPLAVVVRRTRVSNGGESRIASSAYVGIAPAVAGFWDAGQKAYVTVIPWVETSDTSQTILHLQNIGLECAEEVELEFISGPGGCVPASRLLPTIRPGRALTVTLDSVFEEDFSGSVWIRSPQPLAVVVDRRLDDGTMLATHATGRAAVHQMVDAPLVLQDGNNWNTRLRVQNAGTRFTALVEMAYRTSEITPTVKSEHVVCLGGSTSADTATVTGLTQPFTGTVALRSLALGPDQPEIPPLAADVDLLGAGTGAAYHAPNRITDTLIAPDIALPWLTRAYPLTTTLSLTYTARIAVMNQSEAGDGFISLTFYDADGSIRSYQPETPLGPGAMRVIDLADVSELPAGWHGSAILQFLSLQSGASVAVAVLETASGAAGDTMAGYAGIVAQVQAQPTPTPPPTATVTPHPTPTSEPTATATPTIKPTSLPDTYLPLLHR